MNITINRDGKNFGPYTVEQANSMLAAGRLSPGDLAWPAGAPEWIELSAVQGILQVPPPVSRRAPRQREAGVSDRLILPAFLLAFFFGIFGVHRFYVGRTGSGITMLVLSITVIGLIVTAIWMWVDIIILITGGFVDGDERKLKNWT